MEKHRDINNEKFAGKYRIPSARAAWWNYGNNGAYFVTICTASHRHYFGKIVDDEMILNELGLIADQFWLEIPKHFPFVELAEHIVMPNRVHGIIHINKPVQEMNTGISHTMNHFGPQSRNLGSIIRGFKSGVKSYATTNHLVFHWQERFHDHIIRDDEEYRRIAYYIVNNPATWKKDKFYNE